LLETAATKLRERNNFDVAAPNERLTARF
jgi:hypothetical protein